MEKTFVGGCKSWKLICEGCYTVSISNYSVTVCCAFHIFEGYKPHRHGTWHTAILRRKVLTLLKIGQLILNLTIKVKFELHGCSCLLLMSVNSLYMKFTFLGTSLTCHQQDSRKTIPHNIMLIYGCTILTILIHNTTLILMERMIQFKIISINFYEFS